MIFDVYKDTTYEIMMLVLKKETFAKMDAVLQETETPDKVNLLKNPDFVFLTEKGNIALVRESFTDIEELGNLVPPIKEALQDIPKEDYSFFFKEEFVTTLEGRLTDPQITTQFDIINIIGKTVIGKLLNTESINYDDVLLDMTNDFGQNVEIGEIDDDVYGYLRVTDDNEEYVNFNFSVFQAYQIYGALDRFLSSHVRDHDSWYDRKRAKKGNVD